MTKIPDGFRVTDSAPDNKNAGVAPDGNPHLYDGVFGGELEQDDDLDLASIPPNLARPNIQNVTQYGNVPGKGRLKK